MQTTQIKRNRLLHYLLVTSVKLMTGKDFNFAVIHVINYSIIGTEYSDTAINQVTNFRKAEYEYLI